MFHSQMVEKLLFHSKEKKNVGLNFSKLLVILVKKKYKFLIVKCDKNSWEYNYISGTNYKLNCGYVRIMNKFLVKQILLYIMIYFKKSLVYSFFNFLVFNFPFITRNLIVKQVVFIYG